MQTTEILPIPGLDVVGRGIYLRPRQPYVLKGVLFKRENEQTYYSNEAGASFNIPENYAVNDSPPMPAKQALNQSVIEESWERFDKHMGLDASMAAGGSAFSIDVNVSQASQLRSEEESFYALRTSFIPLWSVYVTDVTRPTEGVLDMDVTVPFEYSARREYEAFFQRYGTHFVNRAWVGGKATVVFTVSKSSNISKEEIQAGIKASYGGMGKGSLETSSKQSQEKLRNNSEVTVFGKGGDELKLAALSSLDETLYNQWLGTVKGNPQVIELEVMGIWTLIPDEDKAKALRDAYQAMAAFEPISTIFEYARRIYFVRGNLFFTYDIDSHTNMRPQHVDILWPFLGKIDFTEIDSALVGNDLTSPDGEDLRHKLFLFKRDQYIRCDAQYQEVDEGYPRPIAEGWPGVTFDRIDAAFNAGPDAIYFFSGNEYIRFNMLKNCADEGYPDLISKRWTGVTFDRIDAAMYRPDGKVYFFRDDQHIRYDMVTYRADPGYPRYVVGSYVGDWKFFV